MAAPGAGLGAYVQAQKRAKSVEAEISKAHPHKGISKPGESVKDQQSDGEDEKEQKEPTVASLAKKVVDKAVGSVSSATALKHPHDTMDSAVARIVNFSDSDDDEQPLKPRAAPDLPEPRPPLQHDVKDAMLGKRVIDGARGVGGWLTGSQRSPMQLSTGQRGVRRIQSMWSQHGAQPLRQARAGITLGLAIKVLALWLLRRKKPRVGRLVELFCLAVPAGDALCRWQQKRPRMLPGRVGEGIGRGLQCSRELAVPAAIVDVAQWLQRRARKRQDGGSKSSDVSGGKGPTDQAAGPPMPHVNTSSRAAQTPRTPRRLTFQDTIDGGGSPARHLQGLSDVPLRAGVRKTRSDTERRRECLQERRAVAAASLAAASPAAAVARIWASMAVCLAFITLIVGISVREFALVCAWYVPKDSI